MHIHVRVATSHDRAFILALAERFGPTRAVWRTYDEVVAGTRAVLAAALDAGRDGEAILIASRGPGEDVGFLYLVTERDFFTGETHGHISEIATAADGSGAGSALMAAAEEWSRRRGFRYLSLNVNDTNEKARRFYERRAYEPEYRHLIKLL